MNNLNHDIVYKQDGFLTIVVVTQVAGATIRDLRRCVITTEASAQPAVYEVSCKERK